MGAYLSEPVTSKDISTDEDGNFWVSSASMQGWRVSQEVSGFFSKFRQSLFTIYSFRFDKFF